MRYYAGIGSRETPRVVLDWMKRIAAAHRTWGWCLRSGGAGGADSAFYKGMVLASQPGKLRAEIFLPFDGFNGYNVDNETFFTYNSDAMKIAKQYHPAWDRCSPQARRFHARNVHQVLGIHLNLPVEVVICWTKDGEASGGTGQALRIAKDYPHRKKIHIVNLQRPIETLPQHIRELR
ncbi:hypothetical protein EVB91_114 [Rhizobium phage RHph_I1_18]|nr:hypothetical protein EVB91_114 [Rhizobium phage RHph_I1_18]